MLIIDSKWIALGVLAVCAPAQSQVPFTNFLKELEDTQIQERDRKVMQYLAQQDALPIVEGEGRVHFVRYSQAQDMRIEGDIQKAWSAPALMDRLECGDKDLFHISYTVPSDAVIEYRFVEDGTRSLDEKNPWVAQSFDYGDRNVLAMPKFEEAHVTKPRYGISKGITNRWVFRTDHPRFTNQLIWIYTPHGYSNERDFPVAYVYDGMWAVHDRPFINVLDNLIADRKIEPVVVVFLSFEDRYNEYVVHSEEHATWLVEEIVPFIEKSFAVSKTPVRRAVMGASAAGHAAMVAALRYPNVFGNVAAQGAGAGGYPGHNPHVNEALQVYLSARDKHPLRTVYTEVGLYDLEFPDQNATFLAGARQFHARLREENIEHLYREVNGGHTGYVWDQRLEEILTLFFGIEAQQSKHAGATIGHSLFTDRNR
jgi:enterochelin esterase-like enzyme